MNVKFLNKLVLIEGEERIVVIGDLHIGYFESLRNKGQLIPEGEDEIKEIIKSVEEIISSNGRVDRVILIGDLKHEFGSIGFEERKSFGRLISFFEEKKCELVIIKGNHDVLVPYVAELKGVKIVESFVVGEYAFLHGDKEIKEVCGKNIKVWVMGHGHPALSLKEGVKEEKYKCFLYGKYKGKKVVIMPSFFSGSYGTDPREFDLGLAWKFNLNKFKVLVVGDEGVVRDFGVLEKIK